MRRENTVIHIVIDSAPRKCVHKALKMQNIFKKNEKNLRRIFSVNFPAPICWRFEGFPLFSVVSSWCRPIRLIHKILGYL